MLIGKAVEAFSDFYSIESNNVFPKELLQTEVYPNLTSVQKKLLKMQDFFVTAVEYRKICEVDEVTFFLNSLEREMDDFEIIEDLTFVGFCRRLEQYEIRLETSAAERLFKALTLEETGDG